MEAKFSIFQNIRKCFGSGIIGYDEKVPYHYITLGTKKKDFLLCSYLDRGSSNVFIAISLVKVEQFMS